jgi:hypothetical protein
VTDPTPTLPSSQSENLTDSAAKRDEIAPEALGNSESPQEPEEVFDPAYVAQLRQEAAQGRVKAKRADALARQAVKAIAAGDGRLIDADDLAFDPQFLDDDGLVDTDRVTSAIASLIERKPHLAARRPTSAIAQGAQPDPGQVSLLDLLSGRA